MKVNSIEALQEAINVAQPGDTIELEAGNYSLDRILRIDESDLTIKGAGIRETIIGPKNGRILRAFGDNLHFEGITFDCRGGGTGFAAAGNNISVTNCSFEECTVGVMVSGNGFRMSQCFVYSNEKTGVEVNGGFIYRPEWGEREPIRMKQALGLIAGQEGKRNDWTPEQLAEMEALWERRDMDCKIELCYFHENGLARSNRHPDGNKFAQTMYGAHIKAVPHVSGLTVSRCFGTGAEFSNYWIDWPSKGENLFSELYCIGGQHGAHIEGGYTDDQRTVIEDCVFWNVHQGIFNSASEGNVYRNNLLGAYKYGFVNHGMKGNREDRDTVSHWINNEVYMFPSMVERLGETTLETPKGHAVWFAGPNADGSTREENTFYLTPDFPDLKISMSLTQGYSFAKSNLGEAFDTEKVVYVDELPEIVYPSWFALLPLLDEYSDGIVVSDIPVNVSDIPANDTPGTDPVATDPVIDIPDPIIDDPISDNPIISDTEVEQIKAQFQAGLDIMIEALLRLKDI